MVAKGHGSIWLLMVMGPYSLAASPSPPGRRAAKPRKDGGEGLANIALDCVSTDQSDLTEAIRSNYSWFSWLQTKYV